MLVRIIARLDRRCGDDGNVYVAREFTDDMRGKVLPDNKVVRAGNGRYFFNTQELKEKIRERSNMDCPTYGTCGVCLSSGPTAFLCRNCKKDKCYYCIAEGPYREKILDSEWISRLVGATHMNALGDRTVEWEGPYPIPTTLVDHARIRKHLWTIYSTSPSDELAEKDAEQCAAHSEHWDLFRAGVNETRSGKWDVRDKKIPLIDPNEGCCPFDIYA